MIVMESIGQRFDGAANRFNVSAPGWKFYFKPLTFPQIPAVGALV